MKPFSKKRKIQKWLNALLPVLTPEDIDVYTSETPGRPQPKKTPMFSKVSTGSSESFKASAAAISAKRALLGNFKDPIVVLEGGIEDTGAPKCEDDFWR